VLQLPIPLVHIDRPHDENEDINIDLDFGREVSIYQDRIEKIIFDKELLEKLSGEAMTKEQQQ